MEEEILKNVLIEQQILDANSGQNSRKLPQMSN
jgi:hypothetical protein